MSFARPEMAVAHWRGVFIFAKLFINDRPLQGSRVAGRQHNTKDFRGTHDRCAACVKARGRIASPTEFRINGSWTNLSNCSLLFII
jgi:hypothetical protein